MLVASPKKTLIWPKSLATSKLGAVDLGQTTKVAVADVQVRQLRNCHIRGDRQ